MYRTERDPVTQAVKTDHSLISMQQGIAPGRYITSLGGLDTTGTEGAALFVTSKRGIQELERSLATSGETPEKDRPFLFQAILKVDVQRGDDVLDTHLVRAESIHPKD